MADSYAGWGSIRHTHHGKKGVDPLNMWKIELVHCGRYGRLSPAVQLGGGTRCCHKSNAGASESAEPGEMCCGCWW